MARKGIQECGDKRREETIRRLPEFGVNEALDGTDGQPLIVMEVVFGALRPLLLTPNRYISTLNIDHKQPDTCPPTRPWTARQPPAHFQNRKSKIQNCAAVMFLSSMFLSVPVAPRLMAQDFTPLSPHLGVLAILHSCPLPRIVRGWLARSVAKQVERADVLERMAGQTLVHPIRHGARVRLPPGEREQRVLFE